MFDYPWGITEDNLTGDFFGLMKHLPPDVLLVPFLQMVHSLYPDCRVNLDNIKKAEVLLWSGYEVPEEWQDQFNRPEMPAERRRSKYYIVPDVILNFDDCIIIIEAEKSHSVEAEQLFQQYLIGRRYLVHSERGKRRLFTMLINTDQIRPYGCHVAASDPETGIVIEPADSIPQYIHKRARMLGENIVLNEINSNFIWISWHHIGKLIKELLDKHDGKADKTSKLICGFISGINKMFDREGFYPVRLFRADDPNEVSVDDYSWIPVLATLPDWKAILLIDEQGTTQPSEIEPLLIPASQIFGDLANWLSNLSISYEGIGSLASRR